MPMNNTDPLYAAAGELYDELAMNRARERGEVSDIEAIDPTTLEHGVYTFTESGELEFVGTHEQVTDELTEAFAQAVVAADNYDYDDYDE